MKHRALFGLSISLAACLGGIAQSETAFVGTASIPSGFGLSGGSFAVTASGSIGSPRNPPVDNTRFDASLSAVIGFGDPVDALGFQAGIDITSVRHLGESGYIVLGVHKMFQVDDRGVYSLALNASHIAPWGNSTVLDPGYSLMGSYLTSMGGRLATFSVGAATDTNPDRDIEGVLGFGIGVNEYSSFSIGQVGKKSVVGASFSPDWLAGSSVSLAVNHNSESNENSLTVDLSRVFNRN